MNEKTMRARSFETHAWLPLVVLTGFACGSAGDAEDAAELPGEGREVEAVDDGAGTVGESGVSGLVADGADGACETGSSGEVEADESATEPLPPGEVGVAGTCASSVAAETFTSSLCSCEDTNVAGFLRTRSFRSSEGPGAPELLGGSVGVNRSYLTGGFADVGGSFAVAGPRDVIFAGALQVGEDLRFNPSFDVAGFVNVSRDAWLGGSLRAVASIAVGRDLYRAPGAGLLGLAFLDVGGEQRTEVVTVPSPCACAPDELLDVAALVVEARTDNDNARLGLDPGSLDLAVGIGTALVLPTGRFYLNQLGGVGALSLRISGKVALFVEDDFVAGGLFRVTLDPGAEVDIFVRDNFVLAGAALLGDPARPRATRIYVGGTGDVAVAGLNAFVGNLYAPTANVLVGGVGRVYGSLFGKNIVAAGFLDVGYDASILEGGPGCPPAVDDPSPPTDAQPPADVPVCPPSDVPNVR